LKAKKASSMILCEGILCEGILCEGILCEGILCEGILWLSADAATLLVASMRFVSTFITTATRAAVPVPWT